MKKCSACFGSSGLGPGLGLVNSGLGLGLVSSGVAINMIHIVNHNPYSCDVLPYAIGHVYLSRLVSRVRLLYVHVA